MADLWTEKTAATYLPLCPHVRVIFPALFGKTDQSQEQPLYFSRLGFWAFHSDHHLLKRPNHCQTIDSVVNFATLLVIEDNCWRFGKTAQGSLRENADCIFQSRRGQFLKRWAYLTIASNTIHWVLKFPLLYFRVSYKRMILSTHEILNALFLAWSVTPSWQR